MPQLGGELTLKQMISKAASAGFQSNEIGRKFPADPQKLNQAIDLRDAKTVTERSFQCRVMRIAKAGLSWKLSRIPQN